jgi:CRISPR system Cascade subunit CasE
MFFSKVTFNPTVHARSELIKLTQSGAYAAHQLLWKLFTHEPDRSFLFREEIANDGVPAFYILSQKKPLVDTPSFSVASKPYQPQLKTGDRLAYKLRVNPTVSISVQGGRSKRHDVLMHAKQQAREEGVTNPRDIEAAMHNAARAWLADEQRLTRWGFKLDSLPDVERYTQHKFAGKHGRPVQFSSVDLQGILTVEDPDKFLASVCTGIGKSKAFGCGLLLIRRI